MSITVEKNNDSCKVKIQGEMNIFNSVELKQSLLNSLIDSSELTIDLSEVSEMDTAGFQLLVMLKLEADCLSKGFRIVSPSPSAQTVMELYRVNF